MHNPDFLTDTVLMIEPVSFALNTETAINNFYQKELPNTPPKVIQKKALEEFLSLKKALKKVGIRVISVKDTIKPITPDSIFPNNWISFHQKGIVCVYPMFAKNRRLERREDILELVEQQGFLISELIDFTKYEEKNRYLEGTGSMVLDRKNKVAYCALSPRSDEELFIEFCEIMDYQPICFLANQTVNNKRVPIYHTNVMMSIGNGYVMICLDAIDNKTERKQVIQALKQTNKEIITLTENQITNFSGNTLQLFAKGKEYIVMSDAALKSLSTKQINTIEKYATIISVSIPTIEKLGGGSVRCMLAEVFL